MENILEIFKTGVIQTIISAILAIVLVFVSKNHEIYTNKRSFTFDKKRGYFYKILSLIAKIIIYIKSRYSLENDSFDLISEKDCDEFELMMKNKFLYLNDNDIFIINFIVDILRQNSSWLYNIANSEDNVSFNFKDIKLVEYLYETLARSFKKQLFEKKYKNNVSNNIIFLKISNFYINWIKYKNLVDDNLLSKYNYNESTILKTIENCNKNKQKLLELLKEIFKKYKEKENNTDIDFIKIEELSNLITMLEVPNSACHSHSISRTVTAAFWNE
jgi:hypothetical protein